MQVQVRQDKSNPASSLDSPVNIGTNALTLVEIKLSSKQQMKRMKRRKKGATGGDDLDSQDDEPADEGMHCLRNQPFKSPAVVLCLAFLTYSHKTDACLKRSAQISPRPQKRANSLEMMNLA